MGCTPNSFQQFLLQGKTTIKRHVICSLFVVSTLWGRKTIFIPGLRAKVHGCFYWYQKGGNRKLNVKKQKKKRN